MAVDPKNPNDDDAQSLSLLDEDEIADMDDDSLVDEDRSFEGGDDAENGDAGSGDEDAGGDGDDDDAAAKPGDAEEEGEDGDAGAGGEGEDPDAAAKAAAEAAAAAKDGQEGEKKEGSEGEGAGEPERRVTPAQSASLPNWQAPADAKERIASIEKQIDELDQKYDDGELTRAEYRAEERKLAAQRDELREQVLKASISHEARVTTYTEVTVPQFLAAHPEYRQGSIRYQMLDQVVRDIQRTSADPLSAAVLEEAHARIAAEFGGGTPQKQQKTAKDLPRRDNVPPNLGKVPAADVEVTGNAKFAALDRLKGEELEDALAKLSDTEMDAYLAYQG